VQFRVSVTKAYYSRTHVRVPGCAKSGRGGAGHLSNSSKMRGRGQKVQKHTTRDVILPAWLATLRSQLYRLNKWAHDN